MPLSPRFPPRALLGAAVVAAAAGAALRTGDPAAAAIVERHDIAAGDVVLGDNLVPGDLDEYVVPLPRGAVVSITLVRSGAGGWKPRLGVFDDDYRPVRIQPFLPLRTEAIPRTGLTRFLVGNAPGSVGGYRFGLKVAPLKRTGASGSGDAAPKNLVFGALPGSEVDVSIRWKGPAAVTLAGLTTPSGPLGGASAPVVKSNAKGGKSSQTGFDVTTLDDVTLALDVPAGTVRWSVAVKITPPRPGPGANHDFRSVGPPEPPTLDLPATGDTPMIVVRGERGGPNDLLFTGGTQFPGAISPDGSDTGGCFNVPIDAGRTRVELRCRSGYVAELSGVLRDPSGRITSFVGDTVRSPAGNGSIALTDITYAGTSNRATGWREVRRFDGTGAEHRLEVSDIRRFPSGAVKSYVVVHTPPDGVPRTYQYGIEIE